MKSQRIFSTLVITALMLIATSGAHAQTSGAAELKKRIFEQLASGTRTQPVENLEAASLTAAPLAAQQDGLPDFLERQKKAFLGTWNLTLTFSDGSQVKSTLNVMPGRTDSEGTVIHSAELSLSLPNPTLPEQGVWQHNGGQQFIASYRGYTYTEKLEPFGTIGFRHALTLSEDQEAFTGQAVFEFMDATGQVLFSDHVQTRGVRQHAVAP